MVDLFAVLKATVLGLVEGATEFIPVSSTGHLIIVSDWLVFTGAKASTFVIFIQLGAVLDIVWLYRHKEPRRALRPGCAGFCDWLCRLLCLCIDCRAGFPGLRLESHFSLVRVVPNRIGDSTPDLLALRDHPHPQFQWVIE